MLRLVFSFLVASILLQAGESRADSDYVVRTPSKNWVHHTLAAQRVYRYFILPDGRVYPGKIVAGEFIVWDRAEPLLISEYPYGGPQSRIPLIETCKLPFYRTEATPKG